jgi:hypothetical protein
MKLTFKITSSLLKVIRENLERPHEFAYERVGFLSANVTLGASGLIFLANEFRPVADEDYVECTNAGALIGPEAIRLAMQWALTEGTSIFHVHSHGWMMAKFSAVDLVTNGRLMPDFLSIVPQRPHGAIVLNDLSASGCAWLSRELNPYPINQFVEIGLPIKRWKSE